jgi:protein-L-isoaspartate(D-aspartate) O-methyltransferase
MLNYRVQSKHYFLFVLLLNQLSCAQPSDSTQFTEKRHAMVRQQIEARGINDKNVLRAMKKVERHKFVPVNYLKYAYADHPLPIGEDQTISQPYIVALMTEMASIKTHDKVLEIGTGSGYQAAILAEICDSVFTIEINKKLSEKAEINLRQLGYKNIFFKTGDGFQGWQDHCPYDAILVTCAPTEVPEALVDQLAEGGRLVIPVGPKIRQNLVLLRKYNGELIAETAIPVRFVPMIDEKGNPY